MNSPPGRDERPWRYRQVTETPPDMRLRATYSDAVAEAGQEPHNTDDTFAMWLRRARIEAGWAKIAATEALAEVDINPRTYFRWESGDIVKPDPREVRKACLRLGLDVREAAVALGILTREELDLPPAPPPMPRTIRNILYFLRAPQVPEPAKRQLLQHIQGAVDFWAQQLGVKSLREPRADERAAGKQITGQ